MSGRDSQPTAQANEFQTHQHRLQMVVKALRESPDPDAFDMAQVFNHCGTPGCAFGHYVWRKDLQDTYEPIVISGRWFPTLKGSNEGVYFFSRKVAAHFGLTAQEQSDLFDGGGCGNARTANQAADYIERFIARKYPLTALDVSK